MDIEKLISEMTVEEKAALVSGNDFMFTNPIPRLGIPRLRMSDGPHGLRIQTEPDEKGIAHSGPATAFPTAACTASGWNPENLRKMGDAIAKECRFYGIHTVLGPGVNIKRNPLCGRNFEYFSEDPLLAAKLGAAMIEGVQANGVAVSLKHFAMNNSENFRFMGNSIASERTMRKLYLKPFEYIVKHAKPATVMCAYNQVNGTYCSEHKQLLTDILRDEWGFDGLVMSDWGSVSDRIAGLGAGLDLEMPGDTPYCRRRIIDSINDGSLPMETLDKACRNILRWIDKYVQPADETPLDWDAHHALAAEIAADCAVLLKNDGVLPFSGKEKLHITGELFENMRYQGAGSSQIRPSKLTTPKEAFDAHGVVSVPLEESEVVLAFMGLTDDAESEGFDRKHMCLPENQLEEIERLCQSGKKVVVVLFGGSPVELPFADKVDAILNLYLPGQNGGTAAYDLVFGIKNPSGKLAETWPMRYEDVLSAKTFGKGINEVYYEGTEVGYRYYNKHNIPVRYPFGFGLSYTTFEKSEWKQDGNLYTQTIQNIGDRFGAEVAQLYLNGELAGFEKVYLAPGESKTVTIAVESEPEGDYSDEYVVPPEPPRFPVTVDSRFTDLRQTLMGKILCAAVMSVPKKAMRKAKRLPEGVKKKNAIKSANFLKEILESNSLRSMSMSAGKNMPYNMAEGFVELTNRHLIRGIRKLTKTIKVPKLPKEEK